MIKDLVTDAALAVVWKLREEMMDADQFSGTYYQKYHQWEGACAVYDAVKEAVDERLGNGLA